MRLAIFFLVFLSFLSCASAKNRGGMENTSTEEPVKVTGRIQIYGNEPHTFVGIVDKDGNEYAVYIRSGEDELRRLQGHLIEFTVVFLDDQQSYGGLFLKGGTVELIEWEIIQ